MKQKCSLKPVEAVSQQLSNLIPRHTIKIDFILPSKANLLLSMRNDSFCSQMDYSRFLYFAFDDAEGPEIWDSLLHTSVSNYHIMVLSLLIDLKKLRRVPKPLTTLECESSKTSHPKWLTISTSWGPTCSWATFIPMYYLQIHRNQNLPPIRCWASKENNNYQLMSRQ